MKKALFIMCMCYLNGFSQQNFPTIAPPNANGQPEYHVQLNEAVILDTRHFANDTARYRYNQLKHYVKIVMPYVNAAVSLFREIDGVTDDLNRKARRKYIKTREAEIKEKFEDKLSSLNITQGRLLVKLINRQLQRNCYTIVKELKNPVTAAYYQSWAKLNGINLNANYDPEEETDLEQIMRSLGY